MISLQCEEGLSRGKGSVKEGSTVLDPGAWGKRSLCCLQTRVGADRMGSLGVGGAKAVRRRLGVLQPEERHFLNFVITTVENH